MSAPLIVLSVAFCGLQTGLPWWWLAGMLVLAVSVVPVRGRR